jgi:ketosteroid isomerase-like protein
MDRRSRRAYIAGLAGVAALSGCQDVLDRSGGNDGSDPTEEDDDAADGADGPAAAVETFYAALDAGRFDVANKLMHNETAQRRVTEERYGDVADGEVSVESTETVEQSEGQAVVRTHLRATLADSGREIDQELEVELRTENGEWKLYSVAPADDTPVEEPTPTGGSESESEPEATGDPTPVVREFYNAVDDGDRAGVNALLHSEAQGVQLTQDGADAMAEASLSIQRLTVIRDTGDRAIVEAVTIISPADSDQEETNRMEVVLRPENGQWKIYRAR